MTPVLFLINVVFYTLASIFSLSFIQMNPKLILLFGLSIDSLLEGRVYTIITSIFFHANVVHVGSNCLFLLIYVASLEDRKVSASSLYIIYFVTGILSSILSLPFLGSAVTLGASGAIFGFLGALIGFEWRSKTPNVKRIAIFAGFTFFLSLNANTNILAHLFGLIIGILLTKYPVFLINKDDWKPLQEPEPLY